MMGIKEHPVRGRGNAITILFFVALVWIGPFSQACAAEMVLKNGNAGKGEVLAVTDTHVTIDLGGVEVAYPFENIASINGLTELSRKKIDDLARTAHEYVARKQYDEAFKILGSVAELTPPHDTEAKADLSEALVAMNNFAEATPLVRKELEKNPNSWRAWKKMGDIYRHNTGEAVNLQKALDAYQKAETLMTLPERDAELRENAYAVGVAYASFGKWEESIPYLRKAAMSSAQPGPQNYYFTALAKSYLALGKPQVAAVTCQKAIRIFSPELLDETYRVLGLAYQSMGKTENGGDPGKKSQANNASGSGE